MDTTKKNRGSYDVAAEVLQANMQQICEAEDKADLCLDCNGIENCKQDTPGMFPVVEAYLWRIGFSMSFCKYEYAERARRRLERLFTFSRVPAQYAGKMFTDYKLTPANKEAVKSTKWAIEHDEKGILLYGTPGTGKSLLTAIMVNEIIRRGRVAMFASLPDLLNDIRNSYDAGNTQEVIQAVNEAPFLVLDDLGAERMTPWVGEQLFSLINSRLSGKRQTVITSNFSPSQLIERMQTIDARGNRVDDMQGKRIMSRINEMCYIVPMNGNDWRAGK